MADAARAEASDRRVLTLLVGHTVAQERMGKRFRVYVRHLVDGEQRQRLTAAPSRRERADERSTPCASDGTAGASGNANGGDGNSATGAGFTPAVRGPSCAQFAADVSAVRGVSFRIVSDDLRVTETYIPSPGPFEWGKLIANGIEACAPVAVTFHFVDIGAPPHIHVHDVMLQINRPVGRGGSPRGPPPPDEVELTLPERKPFRWGVHEAAPGRYLHATEGDLPAGPKIGSAWAARPAPRPSGVAPPQPTDFAAFPPLSGARPSGFVMGRTHSFSSALRLMSPRSSSDGADRSSDRTGSRSSLDHFFTADGGAPSAPLRHAASFTGYPSHPACPRLDPPSRPRAATAEASSRGGSQCADIDCGTPPAPRAARRQAGGPGPAGPAPPAVLSASSRSGRPSPPPTAPSTPLPCHFAPSRAPTPEAFTAAAAANTASPTSTVLNAAAGALPAVPPSNALPSGAPVSAGGACVVQPSPAALAALASVAAAFEAADSGDGEDRPHTLLAPPPVSRRVWCNGQPPHAGADSSGAADACACETPSGGGSASAGVSRRGSVCRDAWETSVEGFDYCALARGDTRFVLAWLDSIGLGCHADAFQHCAVDGKTLATLTEGELRRELGVTNTLHRKRLLLELCHVRAAAAPPPVAPRKERSAPEERFGLEEVTSLLELQQVRNHVERSVAPAHISAGGFAALGGPAVRVGAQDGPAGAGGAATAVGGDPSGAACGQGAGGETPLRVLRVDRVINPQLSYYLEKTSCSLTIPGANRSLPPQGGYFFGADAATTAAVCRQGFDPSRWVEGQYGTGAYLTASAARAAAPHRVGSNTSILLCEAVLGSVWQLRRGEPPPADLPEGWQSLGLQQMRQRGHDSLAVPEEDELVVFSRYQAVPRYMVHFERVDLPLVDHTALLHAAFTLGASHPATADGDGSPLSGQSAPAAAALRLVAAAHLAAGHLAAAAATGAPLPVGCGATVSPPPPTHCSSSPSPSSSSVSLPHPTHAASLPSSSYPPSPGSSFNDLHALLAASALNSTATGASGYGGSYAHGLATFDDGRYEQRLTPSSPWLLGDARCICTRAYDRRTRRDVFLKLAAGPHKAEREAEALRKVGSSHAPELYDQFSLSPADGGGLGGEVLVLEAAQPGDDVSIHQLCRRAVHALSEEGPDPLAAGDSPSLMVTAYAQRVIQLVARVHEVGLVHCDIKPVHFMRFGAHGELKLVDFGGATRDGATTTPLHSLRYVAPELAQALRISKHATIRVRPSFDIWSTGLVLYELFTGRPFFPEAVTYSTVAALAAEGAGAEAVRLRVRQHSLDSVSDAHLRLITSVLAPAGSRPSAAELLLKSCFRAADDTVERRRLEVAAFFSNPPTRAGDLKLMREIQELTEALPKWRREICPAARLSDVASLLEGELMPRLVSFSGHEFAGYLLFEPETDGGVPRVPTADELIVLLSPQRAPQLRAVFLNACKTESLAYALRAELPHLSVVCWRTLAADAAAKAFSRGFYQALARGEGVAIATAFSAGKAAFLRAGYAEGDPDDYLHSREHAHRTREWRMANRESWRRCIHCNPPVHGMPVLVSGGTRTPKADRRQGRARAG